MADYPRYLYGHGSDRRIVANEAEELAALQAGYKRWTREGLMGFNDLFPIAPPTPAAPEPAPAPQKRKPGRPPKTKETV